jgi:peptidyl-prolyl cis-trans isomerase SurA
VRTRAATFATAALLLASGAPALAQQAAAPAERERPILAEGVEAVVNDDVISTVDVRNRAVALLVGQNLPLTEEYLKQARVAALQSLVEDRLKMQEAKRFDFKLPADAVDSQLRRRIGAGGIPLEALEQELAKQGVALSTLRAQIEAEMTWTQLVGGRFGPRVRISDTQVHERMERVMANASKEQLLVSELTIPFEAAPDRAALRAQMEGVVQQLRTIPDDQRQRMFSIAARQYSASATAASGGNLGWVIAGDLRPEFERVLRDGQAGEVFGPIETKDGFHLLGLWQRQPGLDMPAIARVTLKEIAAPPAQRTALDRARKRVQGCEALDRAVASVSGAHVVDIGAVMQADLSEDVLRRIEDLQLGQASEVFELDGEAASLVLCERDAVAEDLPSMQEVEDGLLETELSLISQRYLRNLRQDSTILTP